jgi:hypothetical protein
MNADAADTRHPHLDLESLIAGAAGQPVGDGARAHLARCEQCQREADRWNLVADGVRGLAADASGPARPARPLRTRRQVFAGRWQRTLLVAGRAAAALVLLIGIGVVTGYVHVHLSTPGGQAALTAVTGCSQLQQVDGTLEQAHGSSLVIQPAGGEAAVTVTTTSATFLTASGPLLSDITDGASVEVWGTISDGTTNAAFVTVGPPFSVVNPPGFVPVQGTVSDATTAGFTLVTSGGTRIPVTTSSGTVVVVPHASPGQLPAGATIFALGHAGPNGTLSARAVAAISQLPSGPHASVSVKDCSSRSIIDALGAISTVSSG